MGRFAEDVNPRMVPLGVKAGHAFGKVPRLMGLRQKMPIPAGTEASTSTSTNIQLPSGHSFSGGGSGGGGSGGSGGSAGSAGSGSGPGLSG